MSTKDRRSTSHRSISRNHVLFECWVLSKTGSIQEPFHFIIWTCLSPCAASIVVHIVNKYYELILIKVLRFIGLCKRTLILKVYAKVEVKKNADNMQISHIK